MKIEDLTLKEIREICEINGRTIKDCTICPMMMFCDYDIKVRPRHWGKDENLDREWTTEDMERDIEGVNK